MPIRHLRESVLEGDLRVGPGISLLATRLAGMNDASIR